MIYANETALNFAAKLEKSNLALREITVVAHTNIFHHHADDLNFVTESYIDTGKRNPTFGIAETKDGDVNTYKFQIEPDDLYLYETALFLGHHPAKLALNPESAVDHLESYGMDSELTKLYQGQGLSPQDAAQAIRMQQQLTQTSAEENQAASDFLSSLDVSDLSMDERGMSLTPFSQS